MSIFDDVIVLIKQTQMNQEQETPEEMQGVGGVEQTRARQYVIERCGKA
jgi:26S proteasome non-ATPase regulatory subunit 10